MPATSETVDTLRLATAGSVDDGKSTLIGRLLYDAKSILVRPARAHRGGVARAQRQRAPGPGAADRRPARRARAGHHDRRRAPLLRDPAAALHPRRHAGARAVHAQHGHRRLDRRGRDRAGRRPQGRDRADPAARRGRGPARRAARRARGQQDGPRRLVGGGLRPHRGRLRLLRLEGRARRGVGAADERAARRQRGRELLAAGAGTRARRCSSTSRRSSCPSGEPGELRFPVQWVLRDLDGDGRAYAGRVAGGELRPGAEVVALPAGCARAGRRRRDARRAAGGGAGGPVGVGADRPRARPRPRRHARRRRVGACPRARVRGRRLLAHRARVCAPAPGWR